jgi:hypothetical protein
MRQIVLLGGCADSAKQGVAMREATEAFDHLVMSSRVGKKILQAPPLGQGRLRYQLLE